MARADIAINLDNDQSRLEVKAIVIATGGEGELKANRLRDLTRLASSERRKYPATISIDELHRIADVLTVVQSLYRRDQYWQPLRRCLCIRIAIHLRHLASLRQCGLAQTGRCLQHYSYLQPAIPRE